MGDAVDRRRGTLGINRGGSASSMGKVKVGFAGVGFMGQVAHLRNYLRNPDCEVVAIAEPREGLARKVATAYGIRKVYRNHLELAEDSEVEAVVASQPHLLNGYIATPLLKAGKSVFIEKPMAGSHDEAAEMAEAARSTGAILMVGFMKRYDGGVNLAKREIDEFYRTGEMGPLGLINANCFGGDWTRGIEGPLSTEEPPVANPDFVPRNPAWMTPVQQETFNIYMNIFAHNLNLIRYLFPGKLEVQAAVLKERALNQSTLLTSDSVLINLYGASVRAGWWEEKTELYFENGWVRVATPSPMVQQDSAVVEVYRGGPVNESRQLRGEPYWAFRAQADHFVECIKERKQPRSNGDDCLEDMRIMEEVFRKGTWV
jgi:predicted dehydrogenase